MAKNISLLGADYPDVPAVQLPQTGGGTATFYDIQVIDNLNSESSTDALSAKQGKALNDRINDYKGNSSTDKATLTVTAASGFTLYEVRAVRVGRLIQISGYATGTFAANTDVTFATVNVKPTYNLRTLCGYGTAGYSANKCGYMIWSASDGKITVNLPTAGQAVTFAFCYVIN